MVYNIEDLFAKNFAYKNIKYERMEHFIKWFQNSYQLRDWEISLGVDTGEMKIIANTPGDLATEFTLKFEESEKGGYFRAANNFKKFWLSIPGGCDICSSNLVAKIWIITKNCKN